MTDLPFDDLILRALKLFAASEDGVLAMEQLQGKLGLDANEFDEVIYFLESSEMIECDPLPDGSSHARIAPRGRVHLETKTASLASSSQRFRPESVRFALFGAVALALIAFGAGLVLLLTH